jgi:hypothetical protein
VSTYEKTGVHYIERKLRHWARFGTQAQLNPLTGAAQPKWRAEELEAQEKRVNRNRN